MTKIALLTLFLGCTSLVSFSQNKKHWKVIDQSGSVSFEIDCNHVYEFHNGLARVQKSIVIDNKWVRLYGYVDHKGKEVIPFQFTKANDFKSECTWVKLNGKDHYSLLHKSGKIIPTKPYQKVGPIYDFQPDRFAVYENGKMGFIDPTGKEIIPCKYTGSSSFSEGLVSIAQHGGQGVYGFMDKSGKMAIPFQFKQSGVSGFDGAYSRAMVKGKTVLINQEGKTVLTTTHGNIQGEGEVANLVSVFNGRNRTNWGWVDLSDKVIIPLVYDYAIDFNEDGLAIVEKGEKKGVIDTTGAVKIPLLYETVYCDASDDGYILGVHPSKETLPMSKMKKDFYSASFEKLNLPNVQYMYGAKGGNLIRFVDTNSKQGFLNRNFEVVIRPLYKKVTNFGTNGYAWVMD